MTEPGEVLAAIDAAVYGDVFDCAVTEDELWRYSRSSITREELRGLLDDSEALRGAMCERDGLYCLAGREALFDVQCFDLAAVDLRSLLGAPLAELR